MMQTESRKDTLRPRVALDPNMSYSERPQFAFPSLTPAIKKLLLINLAVFMVNWVLHLARLGDLTEFFGFSWDQATAFYGLGWLRLITYQFTHDWTGVGHILFNMLTLYFFGTMAERALGYRGVFKLYLLGGGFAGLVYLGQAALMGQADVPVVGASGACYAFLVYAACMAPNSLVIFIIFPVKLWILAAVLVFIGFYQLTNEMAGVGSGGVAHSAHMGGALFGFVAWKFGWFRDYAPYSSEQGFLAGYKQKWQQWRQRQKAESQATTRAEVDRVLEKVHQQGLQSLTPAERRVLERQSERNRKS